MLLWLLHSFTHKTRLIITASMYLQSLPRDFHLTAACAQWDTHTLNWGVEPSFDSKNEILERFSMVASGSFTLHLRAERGVSLKIIAGMDSKDRSVGAVRGEY